MINDSLQQLAQAHKLGNISRQEYRQRRAILLDGLLDEPTSTPKLENTLDIDKTQPMPSRVYRYKKHREKILYATISSALIVAMIAFWYQTNSPVIDESTHTPMIHNQALNLINRFLRQDQWDDNTLAKVSQYWRTLPQKERQMATNSDIFQQLTDTTRKKIHEQRQPGLTINTRLHESQLLKFANTLGINPTL